MDQCETGDEGWVPGPIPPLDAKESRTLPTPHDPVLERCRIRSKEKSGFRAEAWPPPGRDYPEPRARPKNRGLRQHASMGERNSSGSAEPRWASSTKGGVPPGVPGPFVAGNGDVDDQESAEHRLLAEINGLRSTENETRVAISGRRITWRIRRIRRTRLFLTVSLAVMSVAAHVGGPSGINRDLRSVLNVSGRASMGEKEVRRTGQNHGQHGNTEAQPRQTAGKP